MSDNLSQKLKRYNYLVGEIDAAYHEISLQKICRLTGLSKQTINSALRKLEKEGFIYLEPLGPKNKNVCLTDTGKHMAKQTACQVLAMENEIFASWPPEDVERYIELTEAYLRDLRNHAGKPADR